MSEIEAKVARNHRVEYTKGEAKAVAVGGETIMLSREEFDGLSKLGAVTEVTRAKPVAAEEPKKAR